MHVRLRHGENSRKRDTQSGHNQKRPRFVPYSCEFNFLRVAFGPDVVGSVVRKTTVSCNFQHSLRGLFQNSHSNGATLITIWRKGAIAESW
jgi:hypothetical protein